MKEKKNWDFDLAFVRGRIPLVAGPLEWDSTVTLSSVAYLDIVTGNQ